MILLFIGVLNGTMSDDPHNSGDTASECHAFDLLEYNPHGPRVFVGSRCEISVYGDPRFDRLEWLVLHRHVEDDIRAE